MKIIITDSYAASCREAANLLLSVVKSNPHACLGLATGGTAQGVYPHLVEAYKQQLVSFKEVRTVNLDEYIGLKPDHPQSYRHYMDTYFFDHVDINPLNTYIPSGSQLVQPEITNFSRILEIWPRDVQLLGVGVNGHIGFNEPGEVLQAGVHVATLDEATIKANARFFASEAEVPKTAITMGVGNILQAGKIVLLATGSQKAAVLQKLLTSDEVTTQVPCTLLKLHRDVTVILDRELARQVGVSSRFTE
ncbi:glucosamine-6-phosphate deaminase [Propionispora vibrioides]|uniref:Glucosamine-6-phosphate deaminase n=1 Tax=Propionispora vibrioides TaxID=112903 RepID=A0A1H8WWS8_9FIRM|nr:glucosamine-6-phosphate deaminase [Propionispora vibrioides]SEP31538.1 glucosamine-6-phosphate deaminase [Propionispora vibrioides]